ncbi:hypothetical protein BTA51_28725, partial [Hahella sp. CCB-MM4]|uniref:DUF6531 domain-containing protein n=1 Tax=Hahella sp. (strain CCB-MM4) TaxID=1926491 RepID=UPI000BD1E0E0
MELQELILAHHQLRGYRIGGEYWIFAPYHYEPSYWLILKREGFSGDLFQASSELSLLTRFMGRDEIHDIFQLVGETPPDSFFDAWVQDALEDLILSGQIKVFQVDRELALRMGNFDDPIYYNHHDKATTGSPQSSLRDDLAEEFALDILARWAGKDKVDRLHWSRSFISRELVEAYDVAAEAVDTIADLIVGLWDILKFTIEIAGDGLVLMFDVSVVVAQFQQKLLSGDIDGIKQDLKALGIEVADAMDSAEKLVAKAKEGYAVFEQLIKDPTSQRLIMDYLESLWETIPYRDSRTIGVRIVAEVGVEVLLAMATGGAGNLARRAAQAGAKGVKVARASRIGPFTAKAIDMMVDLARELKNAQKVHVTPNQKWLNGQTGVESLPPQRRVVEPPPSSKKVAEPETPSSPAHQEPVTPENQPGTNKNGDTCAADARTCTGGEPISLVTGEEILTLTDFTLNGPCPLTWERKYKSSHRDDIGLGHGWTHSFAEKLVYTDSGTLVYHTAEARLVQFILPEPGTSVTHHSEQLTLTCHEPHHFSLRSSSGTGVIRYFGHREGQQVHLSAVRNAFDSGVSLKYDEQHRLTEIVADHGARWTLSYRGAHIIKVDWHSPEGESQTQVRYHYDEQNDLIQAGDANDKAEHYAYRNHQIARRTLKSGYRFYFTWSDNTPAARCLRNWGDHVQGVPTYDYTFDWQPDQREVAVTDTRGGVEHYRFNELGLPVYHRNQEGGETHYDYDDHGNLTTTTNALGQVEKRAYNDQQQLTQVIDTEGKTLTLKRNSAGQVVEALDTLDQPWRRTYTEHGLLKTQTNPLGETVSYEYNELGLPLTMTNPLGDTWRYLWDHQGQLTAIRNPQGQHVRYQYTPQGQVKSITLPDGARTEYHYNPGGQCIRIDTPDGQQEHFRYNGLGLMTEHQKPDGRITRYAYNGLSQVVKRKDSLGHELHYHYDGERNLVGLTNENGDHYQLKYDLNERLIEEIGFDGRQQRYEYNALGHLIASEEHRPRSSGNQQEQGDTGTCLTRIRYVRDPQGRLQEQWLDIEHGQPTSECLKRFAYDKAGRLIAAGNAHSALEWEYDKAGRMTQVDQNGQVICHEYDALGRRIRSTLPDGEQLDYQWDSAGHTQAIHFNGQQIVGFTRDDLGREIERQHGNQLLTRQHYDPQGRLLEQRLFKANTADAISARQYHYNAGGQLSRIDDQRRGTTEYHYDAVDRLVQVQGPQPETFVHDPAGNVLSSQGEEAKPGQVTNNRLNFHGDSHYTYDDHGNRTQARRGKDQKLVTDYTYNGLNQLVAVNHQGKVTEYQYDALGRRIAKIGQAQKTTFLWNDDVLLSETHYQQGKRTKHKTYIFEPNTFKPLSFVQDDDIYYYHLDHLGTPQEITGPQGDIVWSAQYRAYGNLALADVEQVENNLRFQGQYFDEESGLHYNRFRYYDPGCGRFINQDPIGLLG